MRIGTVHILVVLGSGVEELWSFWWLFYKSSETTIGVTVGVTVGFTVGIAVGVTDGVAVDGTVGCTVGGNVGVTDGNDDDVTDGVSGGERDCPSLFITVVILVSFRGIT